MSNIQLPSVQMFHAEHPLLNALTDNVLVTASTVYEKMFGLPDESLENNVRFYPFDSQPINCFIKAMSTEKLRKFRKFPKDTKLHIAPAYSDYSGVAGSVYYGDKIPDEDISNPDSDSSDRELPFIYDLPSATLVRYANLCNMLPSAKMSISEDEVSEVRTPGGAFLDAWLHNVIFKGNAELLPSPEKVKEHVSSVIAAFDNYASTGIEYESIFKEVSEALDFEVAHGVPGIITVCKVVGRSNGLEIIYLKNDTPDEENPGGYLLTEGNILGAVSFNPDGSMLRTFSPHHKGRLDTIEMFVNLSHLFHPDTYKDI